MNTKTNGLLSVVVGGAALVASTPFARAQPWGESDRRGTIVVTQKAVRAIATGPTLLHVYSATSGGTMFVAPLATGGDADCSGPVVDALSRATPLAADQVPTQDRVRRCDRRDLGQHLAAELLAQDRQLPPFGVREPHPLLAQPLQQTGALDVLCGNAGLAERSDETLKRALFIQPIRKPTSDVVEFNRLRRRVLRARAFSDLSEEDKTSCEDIRQQLDRERNDWTTKMEGHKVRVAAMITDEYGRVDPEDRPLP